MKDVQWQTSIFYKRLKEKRIPKADIPEFHSLGKANLSKENWDKKWCIIWWSFYWDLNYYKKDFQYGRLILKFVGII